MWKLSEEITEDDLIEHFSHFGKIKEVFIGLEAGGTKKVGYALLYAEGSTVDDIIANSPHNVKGCVLDASYPKGSGAAKKERNYYYSSHDDHVTPSGSDEKSSPHDSQKTTSSSESKAQGTVGDHNGKTDGQQSDKDGASTSERRAHHSFTQNRRFSGRGRGRGRGRGTPWFNQWSGPPPDGGPMMPQPGKKALLPYPPPNHPPSLHPLDGNYDYQPWGPYGSPPPMGYDQPFDVPYPPHMESPPPMGGVYGGPHPPPFQQPMQHEQDMFGSSSDFPSHHPGPQYNDPQAPISASKYYEPDHRGHSSGDYQSQSDPHHRAGPAPPNTNPPSQRGADPRHVNTAAYQSQRTADQHYPSYNMVPQSTYAPTTQPPYFSDPQRDQQAKPYSGSQYGSSSMQYVGGVTDSSKSLHEYHPAQPSQGGRERMGRESSADVSRLSGSPQDKGYSQYLRERFQPKQDHNIGGWEGTTSRERTTEQQHSSSNQQPMTSEQSATPSVYQPQASKEKTSQVDRHSRHTVDASKSQVDLNQQIRAEPHKTHVGHPQQYTAGSKRTQVGYSTDSEKNPVDVPAIDTKALKAILANCDNIYSAYIKRTQSKD